MKQTNYQYKYLLSLISGEKKEYISDLSPSDLFISKEEGAYTLMGKGKILHEGCFHFELTEKFTTKELINNSRIYYISMASICVMASFILGWFGFERADKVCIYASVLGTISSIFYYICIYKIEAANLKKQEHNNSQR